MMGIGSFGFTHGYACARRCLALAVHALFLRHPDAGAARLDPARLAPSECAFPFRRQDRGRADGRGTRSWSRRRVSCATDFLILGTGFRIEPEARTELELGRRSDPAVERCLHPPPELAHSELGNFPYLGPDFAFRGRSRAARPGCEQVHCFNFGASVSMGKVSGDIPGHQRRRGLAGQRHRRSLLPRGYGGGTGRRYLDYDTPELLGDEWRVSEWPEETK
jgi:FAD-dependent urate hydroxylase